MIPALRMSAISRMWWLDCLVVADVGGVVAVQAVGGLAEGLAEVASHHVAHHLARPVAWVGVAEEVGDLGSDGVPVAAALLDERLVARLGGGEQCDGAGDVLLEQRGEPVAGELAVVGLDRVADGGLVVEQPRLGCRQVRQVVREADDGQAGPAMWSSQSLRMASCKAACFLVILVEAMALWP